MEEKKVWLEVPRFTGENVPVNVRKMEVASMIITYHL